MDWRRGPGSRWIISCTQLDEQPTQLKVRLIPFGGYRHQPTICFKWKRHRCHRSKMNRWQRMAGTGAGSVLYSLPPRSGPACERAGILTLGPAVRTLAKFDISPFCSELAGMERTTRSSGLCYSVQAPVSTCLAVQLALPLLPLRVINVNIHRLLFLYRFPLSGGRSGGR